MRGGGGENGGREAGVFLVWSVGVPAPRLLPARTNTWRNLRLIIFRHHTSRFVFACFAEISPPPSLSVSPFWFWFISDVARSKKKKEKKFELLPYHVADDKLCSNPALVEPEREKLRR